MDRSLRLQVVLQAIDKVRAPMRAIADGSSAAAKALKAARDELKQLKQQQAAVAEFRKIQAATRETATELRAMRGRLEELRKAHGADAEAAKAHALELAAGEQHVKRLTAAYDKQMATFWQARTRLKSLGITQISAEEARLADKMKATTAAIDQQRAKLDALAAAQKRHQAVRSGYDKALGTAAGIGAAGVATGAAGGATLAPVLKAVKDFASFEDAMLGVARQVPGARDQLGQLTPVYEGILQMVHQLGRELPLATNDIAEMVTAGARMEVPTEALRDYTRTAAMMAVAFDAVPSEIAEQMGKIGKNFKIPITEIQGLADSINYLDDNAISKGAEIIDVLNRISGVVSTVKMSSRDAAALASTLLTLGERPEAAATAINAMTQKLAAATKGMKKFQQAVGEIGLNSGAIQAGMGTDATGTFLQVVEAIRKLPQSKRIGVMVELVGLEHSDTLAKLVDKPEELARQRDLANGMAASGSMAREFSARVDTLSARWQMANNRFFEASTTLGRTLRPALIELMNSIGGVLERISAWSQAHPVLTGALLKTAAAVGAILVVLGSLLVAVAAVLAPLAVVRYGFALLGLRGLSLIPIIRGIGTALLWVGRALFLNPIGLAVTAIAGAALLIYTYWEPIKAFFSGLWDSVTKAFSGGTAAVLGLLLKWSPAGLMVQAIGACIEYLASAGPKFLEAGGQLLQALVDGIIGGTAGIVRALGGAVGAAIDWVKGRLGFGAPGAPAGGPQAPVRMDTRPPLKAWAAAAPAAAGQGGNSYAIQVHASPGMDERALARAVASEMDRRDRQSAARNRARLSDTN